MKHFGSLNYPLHLETSVAGTWGPPALFWGFQGVQNKNGNNDPRQGGYSFAEVWLSGCLSVSNIT